MEATLTPLQNPGNTAVYPNFKMSYPTHFSVDLSLFSNTKFIFIFKKRPHTRISSRTTLQLRLSHNLTRRQLSNSFLQRTFKMSLQILFTRKARGVFPKWTQHWTHDTYLGEPGKPGSELRPVLPADGTGAGGFVPQRTWFYS